MATDTGYSIVIAYAVWSAGKRVIVVGSCPASILQFLYDYYGTISCIVAYVDIMIPVYKANLRERNSSCLMPLRPATDTSKDAGQKCGSLLLILVSKLFPVVPLLLLCPDTHHCH